MYFFQDIVLKYLLHSYFPFRPWGKTIKLNKDSASLELRAGNKSLHSLQGWWLPLKKGVWYQKNQTMSCPNAGCAVAAQEMRVEGRQVQGSSHEEVWKEEGGELSNRGRGMQKGLRQKQTQPVRGAGRQQCDQESRCRVAEGGEVKGIWRRQAEDITDILGSGKDPFFGDGVSWDNPGGSTAWTRPEKQLSGVRRCHAGGQGREVDWHSEFSTLIRRGVQPDVFLWSHTREEVSWRTGWDRKGLWSGW